MRVVLKGLKGIKQAKRRAEVRLDWIRRGERELGSIGREKKSLFV